VCAVTTFGLVHGAWHGAWCWQYLAKELEARGFASITPELPIDDAAAGLAEYANTVMLPGSHSPFLSRPAALADVLVELSR
jgi:hypothetical protein